MPIISKSSSGYNNITVCSKYTMTQKIILPFACGCKDVNRHWVTLTCPNWRQNDRHRGLLSPFPPEFYSGLSNLVYNTATCLNDRITQNFRRDSETQVSAGPQLAPHWVHLRRSGSIVTRNR